MSRLITELICYANGAELKDYSENLAVDDSGELIKEVQVKVMVMVIPVISEITITIGKNLIDE